MAHGHDTQSTANRMVLAAIDHALKLLNASEELRKSPLILRTPLKYITLAINQQWHTTWRQNNWRRKDGQPVAHADLWETISDALEGHRTTAATVDTQNPDRLLAACVNMAAAHYDAAERSGTRATSHNTVQPETRQQATARLIETIIDNADAWQHQGFLHTRITMIAKEYRAIKAGRPA